MPVFVRRRIPSGLRFEFYLGLIQGLGSFLLNKMTDLVGGSGKTPEGFQEKRLKVFRKNA